MEFKEIIMLYYQRKYQEFYEKIISIEKDGRTLTEDINEIFQLEVAILEILRNLSLDKEHEALERINRLMSNEKIKETIYFNVLNDIVYIYYFKGFKDQIIGFSHVQASYKDDVRNYFKKIDDTINAFSPEDFEAYRVGIAFYYYFKGMHYRQISDWQTSFHYLEQSLKLFRLLENNHEIMVLLLRIGYNYSAISDLSQAIEYHEEALKIANHYGFLGGQSIAHNNLGGYYQRRGDYQKSLDHYTICLEKNLLARKLNPKFLFWPAERNLGSIYLVMGEYDKALTYVQKALEIEEKNNLLILVPSSLTLIGEIYHQKKEYTTAKEYFERALEGWTYVKTKYDFYIPQTFFRLSQLMVDMGEKDKIEPYITRLKQLEQTTPNKETKNRASLCIKYIEAILLKNSRRFTEKAEAQKIFSEILSDKVVQHDITALARIQLAELLIEEYKSFEDPEVLNDAKKIVLDLYELGIGNNIHSITINALILKSKFALVENNIQQAFTLLDQAKTLAEEKKLGQFLEKIKGEIETTQKDFIETPTMNLSVKEQLESLRLEFYLDKIKNDPNLRDLV